MRELSEFVLLLRCRREKPERVEAEVARSPIERALSHAIDLREANGLESTDEEEQQEELVRGRCLMSGVRGKRRILLAWELDAEVHGHVARPRELTHASVLELGLAHPFDVLRRRKAPRVKSGVAYQALEVR